MASSTQCRSRTRGTASRCSVSPAADKKHVIAQGGHFVAQDALVRETLDWLDKYLGPPRVVRRDAALAREGG
jgi:hypothetical protein